MFVIVAYLVIQPFILDSKGLVVSIRIYFALFGTNRMILYGMFLISVHCLNISTPLD
jgi:hypothetical protein